MQSNNRKNKNNNTSISFHSSIVEFILSGAEGSQTFHPHVSVGLQLSGRSLLKLFATFFNLIFVKAKF